jgi:hypothetical protein
LLARSTLACDQPELQRDLKIADGLRLLMATPSTHRRVDIAPPQIKSNGEMPGG